MLKDYNITLAGVLHTANYFCVHSPFHKLKTCTGAVGEKKHLWEVALHKAEPAVSTAWQPCAGSADQLKGHRAGTQGGRKTTCRSFSLLGRCGH